MTEEEEYRNAGITKEECRKTPEEKGKKISKDGPFEKLSELRFR